MQKKSHTYARNTLHLLFLVTKFYLTLHFLYKASTTLKTIYPKMIILEDILKKNSNDNLPREMIALKNTFTKEVL